MAMIENHIFWSKVAYNSHPHYLNQEVESYFREDDGMLGLKFGFRRFIRVLCKMSKWPLFIALPALLVQASCFRSNHGHPHDPIKWRRQGSDGLKLIT